MKQLKGDHQPGKERRFPSARPASLVGPDYPDEKGSRSRTLLIIDHRALERECLAHCVAMRKRDLNVVALADLVEWEKSKAFHPPLAAVLLNLGAGRASEPPVAEQIARASHASEAPLIVLSESTQLSDVVSAIEGGAKGYIPSSVSLDICVQAVTLSIAGGMFIPASSLTTVYQVEEAAPSGRPLPHMFTERQAEVAEALSRGKANKVIAQELNLRESTVKAHVRNIMRKLNATNRTEIAYKFKRFFPRPWARPKNDD